MSDRVLVQVAGGILTATLNRPDKRNAIDTAMIDALIAAVERADLDASVRVVALRGAGRDFCAGMDLNELLASAGHTLDQNRRAALHFAEVFTRIRRMPKPVVAVVQGRALAGGCGLATACDLIIAGESAQFGYPEVQRGFVPAIVMTMLRRAVGEKVAFDLAATGRLLNGTEAAAAGLVSRVYEDSDFEELRTASEVDAVLAGERAPTLVVVNSVCGCAARNARPAAALAIQHGRRPPRLLTVFAGQDADATARARSYFTGYAPSSPQIALFKDGQLVFMLERRNIEGRNARDIAADLTAAFDRFC